MHDLTNLMQVGGLPHGRLGRVLPSGASALAFDMGGVRKVIIQSSAHLPTGGEVLWEDATTFVPMMFSGCIDQGIVAPGEPIQLRLTSTCRRRLAGYGSGSLAGAPERPALHRFVIDVGPRFPEFIPRPPPPNTFTQYASLRPTWWSGAMAEVVQIVGGYGRQDFASLPNKPLERARMQLPERVTLAVAKETRNALLPGYTGLPPSDGLFRFDFKFNHTHIISFDSGGAPWLVRITLQGVYAMPLPMIPATTTTAFRRYVEEAGDDELLWALDRFGGLPSGESMPADNRALQAWVRAGVITKVCDTSDFYQHLFYGSVMGWTTNTRGTEGFNTCFDYDKDTGLSYGYGYKLRLTMGKAENRGVLKPKAIDERDALIIGQYLASLGSAIGETAAPGAIRYKLKRADPSKLLVRAKTFNPTPSRVQAEVEFWDNLQAEPIASHSGSVSQTSKGHIGWALGGFKVPEPLQQGCISFVSPITPKPNVKRPRADTIMAGYYVGDQLKVVKFFSDDREHKRRDDEDEDCMVVGAWDKTLTEGMTGLMGSFYTSDFDERTAAADTTTRINIVGTDLGYDAVPRFEYDHWYWRPGTLFRNRYFRTTMKSETTAGFGRQTGVCLPYMDRNAALHACRDDWTGKRFDGGSSIHYIRDPTSYRYWTNDPIFAWIGGVSGPQATVPVAPKYGNPVWVVQQNYDPGPCSDFANQGPWIPGLPADYTWLIHPTQAEWKLSGGGGPPSVPDVQIPSRREEGKAEGSIGFSSIAYTMTLRVTPPNNYFLPSPDKYVGMFYREATKVTAGKCEYAAVGEAHPYIRGAHVFQGWCRIADHKSMHHFIGVINE